MQVITNPLQPLLASLEDFRDMQTLNRRIGDIFEYLDRDQSVSLSMHELNPGSNVESPADAPIIAPILAQGFRPDCFQTQAQVASANEKTVAGRFKRQED